MTFIEVPRRKGDMEAPWWSVVEIDGVKVVYIACPNCGGGPTLHNYKVLDNGTVKAIGGSDSVRCEGCLARRKPQWHFTVRLLNWDPGLIK